MTYQVEFNFNTFDFWSGAVEVVREIFNQQRSEEAEQIIIEYLGDSEEITETSINDFVWFELADIMNLYEEE